MNKQEFKVRWESDDAGGGITFDDIATCYTAWGIGTAPQTKQIDAVLYQVLKAADTVDAESYNPEGVA